eukprot:COSAG02_NODE_2100_length_9827_cov_18.167352_9_plen_588_part_00
MEQGRLEPWTQLAELTGQPSQVASLLRQQLRAHKEKLAGTCNSTRPPAPEPEPEPKLESTAKLEEEAEREVLVPQASLDWTDSPPSRQFKGWAAGAGMAGSEVMLGDKELDDLLARAANLRGRDVSRTLTALEYARRQLAAKDPRAVPTARRQLGRVWAALVQVTAEVPVLRVRMLVGFAEWCEGEEPVGMSDLQTMSAWAAAGLVADKDGEFMTSVRAWDKLLLQLPGVSLRRSLPVLGMQLAMSQALAGKSAAHLRSGEHEEAVSLLRRNVEDWSQRLHNWERSVGGCSSMGSADISEGAVARDELAKGLLLLADALDSAPSNAEKPASAEEAAKLRVRAKSYGVSSAHRFFGRVRSSLGAQCWDSDTKLCIDDSDSGKGGVDSSQWSFEASRSLPFPQNLSQNTATRDTASVLQTRTTGTATNLEISRTYPRAGFAPRSESTWSNTSRILKESSDVSAPTVSGSALALTSNEATLTSKSRSRAEVASKLAKLYKQPGFEPPMPIWFSGLTSNPGDTRGPLDIAYKQVIGPLDGDGRIRGVPGLAPATGSKGALQKRRLILAKMEIQPEIVKTIMAIAGHDPTLS